MDIEQRAKADAAKLKAAVLNQVNKQESWVKANRKALIVGAIAMALLAFIVYKVLT